MFLLEIEADVCCCKSECGLLQKNSVQQDAKLQNALIILVLFSESYFVYSQCMEELIVASSMKKCIIPVVLSSLMNMSPENMCSIEILVALFFF